MNENSEQERSCQNVINREDRGVAVTCANAQCMQKLNFDRMGESGAEAAFGNAECESKLSKRDRTQVWCKNGVGESDWVRMLSNCDRAQERGAVNAESEQCCQNAM